MFETIGFAIHTTGMNITDYIVSCDQEEDALSDLEVECSCEFAGNLLNKGVLIEDIDEVMSQYIGDCVLERISGFT